MLPLSAIILLILLIVSRLIEGGRCSMPARASGASFGEKRFSESLAALEQIQGELDTSGNYVTIPFIRELLGKMVGFRCQTHHSGPSS